MQYPRVIALLSLTASTLLLTEPAHAQAPNFPGVQNAMSPEAYEQAGLSKLTPAERAKLDEFIRGYVATSSEQAATAAVDQAVKERKVTEPEVIQSNIVGEFRGYNGRSRFALANGQVWAQTQQVSRIYPKVDSPPVLIMKAGFAAHRMYIAGGGNIRVNRVR